MEVPLEEDALVCRFPLRMLPLDGGVAIRAKDVAIISSLVSQADESFISIRPLVSPLDSASLRGTQSYACARVASNNNFKSNIGGRSMLLFD